LEGGGIKNFMIESIISRSNSGEKHAAVIPEDVDDKNSSDNECIPNFKVVKDVEFQPRQEK
jgi:hypothetical protein